MWGEPVDSWDGNFVKALKTPFTLLSPIHREDLLAVLHHIPLTLFFIFFATIGSFLFGILKGVADVFWRGKVYSVVRAGAWIVDALPLFGVVMLVELGTLYASMYIKGDPIHMLPDKSFWGGVMLPAVILLWTPMMYVARILAIAIRQQLGEQYVLTARSKGLWNQRVFMRHVMLNCVPKLLHETTTVFTMVTSGLLALEFLAFRQNGALFNALSAMGHSALGQSTLWTSPGDYNITRVTMYLCFLAVVTLAVRVTSRLLIRKWEAAHNA
jgi:ABC-type dipeptide/oligopeptide/nickel transport system permease component